MSKQWVSIIDYARAHNISDMTVRRRIKAGKLQAVMKNGKYFIVFNHHATFDLSIHDSLQHTSCYHKVKTMEENNREYA